MKPLTRSRDFLIELAQAIGWSLVSVSVGAAVGITVLLATVFLHGNDVP